MEHRDQNSCFYEVIKLRSRMNSSPTGQIYVVNAEVSVAH